MSHLTRMISLAALLALATPALADHTARTATGDDTAMSKLGRGLAGMTTGFLELPGNVYATSERDGALAGATIGFAKGLGMIPVRELVGVYEFVTAPIPVPEDYDPILHPDYPWDYFQGARPAGLASNR